MWSHDWTPETLDEFEAAMIEAGENEARGDDGPGLLSIIDAGKLDMEALVSAFA